MSMIPLVGTLVDKVVDTVAGDSPIGDLVKGGVKIGTAIFTGDIIGGIEGAKNCIDGLSKAPPATVEFLGNAAAFACGPLGFTAKMLVDKLAQGYAGNWQQQFAGSVDTLRKHFDLLDTAHGLGGRDGVIGRCDLESALKNPRIPCELRQACKFLLQNPAAFNQLSANHGAVDGFIKRDDLMCPLPPQPPPGNCFPPAWPPPPVCAPPPAYGAPTDPGFGAPPSASGGGGTDPLRAAWDKMFDQAVQVLIQRFDLLDTAYGLGGRDGVIGRCDLEAAMHNPSIPNDLRDVCRFLLMNPAAFHQLSANKGEVDGFIKRDDLPAKASSTKSSSSSTKSAGTSKSSSASKAKDEDDDTSTKSTGSKSKTSNTKFSGLSAEEIVEAMMQDMLDGLDEELVDAANALEKAETTHKSTAKGSEDEKKSSVDVNRAQAKLQKVMERRRQMFELLSNFSRIGHEMAKAAIGNLGRV